MTESDEQKPDQAPTGGDSEELRWLWIRVGVRLGIGLLVVVATLLLIFGAG
ncbi:MAG: hypothetical protein KAJ11_15185 [Alphaproteobacteria bacterium]|nr:hypothetical protein [Alphaproteobacteria bacterium]MCK5623638.1 hypothetical protein [Alphaproteobacteria bacterium]